ncbi:hypothetical protein BH09SUM1_BH09SUM1_32280 [soil metagenome]
MTFRRSVSVLTYATCLCAFLTLAFSADLHMVGNAIFLAAFFGAALRRHQPEQPNALLWLILSIFALGGAVFGWFFVGEHFNSVIYLFLYLELNKLWNARQNRDVMQIYGLTFFQMLAASVSTANPLFGLALVAYLFLIVASLITFTIKRDAELAFIDRKGAARADSRRPLRLRENETHRLRVLMHGKYFTPRLFGWLVGALVFILIGGAGVFVIIPRMQAQSFTLGLTQSSSTQMTAGFSDTVNFTGIGEIQRDPTIAMRVRPGRSFPMQDGVPSMDLMRLRGTSLDYFNGRSWMKSNPVQFAAVSFRDRTVRFPQDPIYKYSGAFYDVQIQMERSTGGNVFGPDRAAQFYFDSPVQVGMDEISGSLRVQSGGPDRPLAYRVESRFPTDAAKAIEFAAKAATSAKQGRASETSNPPAIGGDPFGQPPFKPITQEEFDKLYLQLPHSTDMDGVRMVSDQWIGDLKQPQEIARRVERELRNGFGYSLDVAFSAETDHLTYFLTQAKAAHCEYFATAMALMLRMHGVPARVVNGYASDEWVASAGGYYIVRQEHAHTWVEAWIPDLGWLTYDPTPTSGIGVNRVSNTWYRRASRWYDTLKFVWYDKVIDYSAKDQTFMFRALLHAMDAVPSPSQLFRLGFSFDRRQQQLVFQLGPGAVVGIIVLTGGLCFGVILLLRLYKRGRQEARKERELELGYVSHDSGAPEFLALLAETEKISPRPASRTPLEHAQLVVERESPLVDFVPLTEQYYSTRFNGGAWTSRETERANALLRLMRENAKDRAAR